MWTESNLMGPLAHWMRFYLRTIFPDVKNEINEIKKSYIYLNNNKKNAACECIKHFLNSINVNTLSTCIRNV